LFCFGCNSSGELGIGDKYDFYDEPEVFTFFDNEKLNQIICGDGFSIAICGIFN
jgi:alpha-tubulin suppressor-like RCC1 family protein